MIEHKLKILSNMLEIIQNYKLSSVGYSSLVNTLEGMMDASDIQDEAFIKTWYELWRPLEEQNAIFGNETQINDIINELEDFENFLGCRRPFLD